MAPTRKKKSDPSTQSLDEISNTTKPRANGVNTGNAHKIPSAKNSSSTGKDRVVKKSLSQKLQSKDDDRSTKKKQNRKNDGSSPSAAKKRKAKSESGATKTANNAGVDEDSSDDEGDYPRIYSQLPAVRLNLFFVWFLL